MPDGSTSIRAQALATAKSCDDEIPDFLLPFVAEHAEASGQAPATSHKPQRGGQWTKVSAKKPSPDKARRSGQNVNLYSAVFRCATSCVPRPHVLV